MFRLPIIATLFIRLINLLFWALLEYSTMYKNFSLWFVVFVFLLTSCGTQVPIFTNSTAKAVLKKGTLLYPLDTNNLGTLAPLELNDKLKTRILFRDLTKSNLSDALIFLQNPNKDSLKIVGTNNFDLSVAQTGNPFYLLPRSGYGKVLDFNASTKIKTRSRDLGIILNPYQVLITNINTSIYYEPQFASRLKLGIYYAWSYQTHKYNNYNYTRSSFTIGPYFSLGTTGVNSYSLYQNNVDSNNEYFTNRQAFGIGVGVITNYSLNDYLGIGLLVGQERIFGKYQNDWVFQNKNLSMGLVFVLKLARL